MIAIDINKHMIAIDINNHMIVIDINLNISIILSCRHRLPMAEQVGCGTLYLL